MLRLVGFFLLVFAAMFVLRELPVVGSVFRIPFLGFWVAAILVSAVGAKLAVVAANRAKQHQLERELGGTDTPYNRGKLGLLFLQQGRAKAAIPHLEAALAADPESDEFNYRLGLARLKAGDAEGAAMRFEELVARNEEFAYGGALLALSTARCDLGEARAALDAIHRHERAFGPTAEGAYRKGCALRALGDRSGAARAFGSIGAIGSALPAYQKRAAAGWWLRGLLGRFGI